MFDPTPSADDPKVIVSEADYEALADVVCASERATPGLALLWRELDRAERLPDGAALDAAHPGGKVTYADLARGHRRTVRLAYPADLRRPGAVPVTSELGAALLGLSPGDVFTWRAGNGALRRIFVEAVGASGARAQSGR